MINNIFNRRIVKLHRERAALLLAKHDFLLQEIIIRVLERIDVQRFNKILDLGCHTGQIGRLLDKNNCEIIQCDIALEMVKHIDKDVIGQGLLVVDIESLPFASQVFDLILSVMTLHTANDLVGTLIQSRECLQKNGLLVATLFGTRTLYELRTAYLNVLPHSLPSIQPFIAIKDAGRLLQRAGFSYVIADTEEIVVQYTDIMNLLYDLRGMGEMINVMPRHLITKNMLDKVANFYTKVFADDQNILPVTFEIITITGKR